jgi:hypothetical protein
MDARTDAQGRAAGDEPATTQVRDRLGMVVLDEDDCWDRLTEEPVGRMALVVGGRPHLVPLNHVVRGRALYVVSVPGTKLHEVLHRPGQPAAFEVDHYDEQGRTGWSVVVSGHLHPVQDLVDHTHQDVRGRPIWLDGFRDRTWLRLDPDRVEGRLLDHPEDDR